MNPTDETSVLLVREGAARLRGKSTQPAKLVNENQSVMALVLSLP